KLLEDLKELAEYKESLENSSNKIATSNSNEEKEGPPQYFNIRQLIREECCVEVCEEQKQNMENTILELVKICQQKELYCMHDNVDDLIESALNSKLLSINLNSQHLNKEKQEVKNVVEQPAEHETRIIESFQNFRVIHKSSISLKNMSQIYPVHAVAPILSTKEPEYSPSMGYEHPNTMPEIESDEIIKSGVEELVPILSEYEVTLEDKRECDLPVYENSLVCDNHSDIFSDSKIDDDILVYDDDFEDIEYVEASLPNPKIVSVEEENDVVPHEKLLSIIHLISNIESLNDNSTPNRVLNSFASDNSLLDNFLPEFETFCDHTEETRSGNTTHVDNSLPKYDSFCFKIEPDQERLINLVKNDIFDNLSNDSLLDEADLFLVSDHSIPPGIENFYDSEGDIRFLKDLLIDDSVLSHESPDSNFEDNPSIPRPPLEPPDAETNTGEEIPVVMIDKDKFDDEYHFFMFDKVFSLLSAVSEDTIFDPANCNISTRLEKIGEDLACLLFDIILSIQKHYFSEVISQEDANMKLPRSLPPAWNNIALIMRNKPDIETLSIDDLYNNLKVYKAEIKGQSSLGSNSHNVAFVSSENTSSINETINFVHDIPAAGLKEQPSALNNVSTITMRVKKFMKRTGRNLNFNGKEPVGFDKTKVECYNCHIIGNFARECYAPRNQCNMSADNERRVVPVETPASSLVVQDGLGGYEWSYQAEEGPLDFTLMAYSSNLANSSNSKGKSTSQREVRPVWNNAKRLDHQNFSKMTQPYPKRNFVPTAVATKSGQVLVNAAKQNSAASTSTVRPKGNPQYTLQDQGIFDSGCSRHMTGNKSFLTEYQKIDGGFVAFGGSPKRDFKLLDESRVLLKVPRQNDMYSFDLKNVDPLGDLTCLFAKAIINESNLCHRRLGHINFKTFNKHVRGNLVRDHLGKFIGKADEGFLVRYSVNSKAFRVFNSNTKKVEENMHVNFLENKPNVAGSGPEWLFYIDSLTKFMNYEPVSAGNQPNGDAGDVNANDQPRDVNAGDIQGDVNEISRNDDVCQENEIRIDSITRIVNTASTSINTASNIIVVGSLNINTANSNHTNMPTLEATGIFNGAFDD
nr:ribonuclease H-like domain-containing protein [Tanacetum cinerariifolium]